MRKPRLIYLLLPGFICLNACSKFLDVKPKGVIIATNINDYEAILNDVDIINAFNSVNPLLPTDDVRNTTLAPQNQLSAEGNFYFWRPYINSTTERPDIWLDTYNRIANLNVITEGVMNASTGSLKQKQQLYAEAQVGKVFCYFHLLSFFSPAYDKNTANTVYGVPYVTSTDISTPTPNRPTLEASQQQLIADLLKAIPDLPEVSINNTRASKAAAFALLSRIYMSMRDYTHALQYADSVMDHGTPAIVDYNQYLSGLSLPPTNNSPEELYVRYTNNLTFRYADDLIHQYDTANDLRIRFFARRNTTGDLSILNYNNFQRYNPNRGITYAEVYLNRAECLARKGDITEALSIVNNDIRKKRFTPATYQPLTATSQEAAIIQVLAERRRELAFKGVRWSDMKRLDKENRMEAVKRFAADNATVLSILEPGSLRYTYQIPLQVQSFNKDMPLNEQ